MNVLKETDSYILIKCPPRVMNPGKAYETKLDAALAQMKLCEELLEEGYRPLDFMFAIEAWLCEKPGVRIAKAA